MMIDRRWRPIPHGTLSGYTGRRCRCAACTNALKEFGRIYRKKNPAAGRAAARLWHVNNKQWHTFQHQLWKRGLTLDQYHALMERQDFCCAVCENELKGRPTIDHCHLTMKVRGLLCMNCNLGLGQFKDNAISLANAASYLEHYAAL